MESIDDEGLCSGSMDDDIIMSAPADSAASMIDIVQDIAGHVCPVLDVASVSDSPVSKGEIFGFYEGMLANNTAISIASREHSGYLEDISNSAITIELAQEIYAWAEYDHPNILKLLGIAEVRGQMVLITPRMKGGIMPLYLEATQTDVDFCRMCTQIAGGVAYLHSIGVVHGDIHGGNVWIGERETIKLCNFDSAYLRHPSIRVLRGAKPRFSIRWMAPELFQGEDVEVNKESDVWALGMTILECITGRVPLEKMREDYVAMRNPTDEHYRPKRPMDKIPLHSPQGDTLWNLLTRCWAHEPSERPSAGEVRNTMRTITAEGLVSDDPTSPISATESHNSWHSAPEN
ncbi:kinase-like protein [Ceratobasidium sp. AG-I]|nr:kinase-like protein [Ceratobasidium sp. AG-I]